MLFGLPAESFFSVILFISSEQVDSNFSRRFWRLSLLTKDIRLVRPMDFDPNDPDYLELLKDPIPIEPSVLESRPNYFPIDFDKLYADRQYVTGLTVEEFEPEDAFPLPPHYVGESVIP